MTVTYTNHVATCKGFGCFWKLLFRWKGSIYKLVWPELLAYSTVYYLFSAVYRFLLLDDQKRLFEKISVFCQYFSDLIPLSFVLGFYVSIVVQRWWEQYMSLPWPDSLALFVSTSIHGQDERSRLMRRTVMRYVNLTQTITLSMISPKVKKRFPTLEHLVEAGFMTSNEQKIFDVLDEKTTHPKYWMPLVWAGSIVARARKEGRIRDDFAVKTIIDEINRIRGLCGGLLSYDWISIPLVYTQVVTLAVYSFFISTLMGRQFLDPSKNIPNQHVDFYIPVFTFLQFFFFMGWLKVAESMVNPFGEDDDDFEVNWLVDRNLQVSYLIVDEMHNEHPELIQDIYWDEVFPQELPYTIASEQFRRDPPQGSTANIEVPEQEQEFLPMVDEEEDEGIQESMSGINITFARSLTDPEKGSTKAINIVKKKKGGSSSTSLSCLGSSQPLATRKPSMLSMLFNRAANSHENVNHRGVKPNASVASMRASRRHRGLIRSASRVSSTSQATCQTPESPTCIPTVITQDSTIFRMSDVSLNTHGMDDVTTPNYKSRKDSGDDDEHIHIKIKQRDTDGNVILVDSSEGIHSGCPSNLAYHLPKAKRPRSCTSTILTELISDEDLSYNEDKRLLSLEDGNLSPGTHVVFPDDVDGHEEESTDHLQQKRKRGLASLNLKGLSKIITSPSSQHGESTTPSHLKTGSPEYLGSDASQEDVFYHHEPHKTEPAFLGHVSPMHQWRPPRVPHNSKSTKSNQPCVNPPLSPIESDETLKQKQYSGDVFVFPERCSPKTSTPEVKFSDTLFPFHDNAEQQLTSKDTLETIIEGPQEGTNEGEFHHKEETRMKLISESELEVIPESDYMVAQIDSERLIE